MVTQKEMEWRTQRGAEDSKRQDDALGDMRAVTASRNERSERNQARDGEIAELSRRIDELRQEVGSVYGTRDVIADLKSGVRSLRQRFFEARLGGGGARVIQRDSAQTAAVLTVRQPSSPEIVQRLQTSGIGINNANRLPPLRHRFLWSVQFRILVA